MSFLLKTALVASLVAARPIAAAPSAHHSADPDEPGKNDVNHDDLFQIVASGAGKALNSKIWSVSSTKVKGEEVITLGRSDGKEPSGMRLYYNKGKQDAHLAILTNTDTKALTISDDEDGSGRHPVTLVESKGEPVFVNREYKHDYVPLWVTGGNDEDTFYGCTMIDQFKQSFVQLFYGSVDEASSDVCEPTELFPLCVGDFENKSDKANRPDFVQAACYSGMPSLIKYGIGHKEHADD